MLNLWSLTHASSCPQISNYLLAQKQYGKKKVLEVKIIKGEEIT